MTFDAIITGAGIIGGSIAWRLAQSGLRVALLDAATMGGEASWAAAGMLAPGGEIEGPSAWNDFALESLRLYPDFVSELRGESGCSIDFQQKGALEIALTSEEWNALEVRSRSQARLEIVSCAVPASELKTLAPLVQTPVAGARFYPQDALVDPRDVVLALRSACLRHGVVLLEGTRVTEIRASADSIEVRSGKEVLSGGVAVLAAGAWSSQIMVPGCQLPRCFPIRGHLLGYQLQPGSLGPIVRLGHTYLAQRANGFTIAGASSEDAGFDRILDPAIVSGIQMRAAELVPVLDGRQPDATWLGFRPAVDGDVPVLGRAGDTALWLAYGHYRNGILLAPETARRIAAAITSSSEKDSFLRTGRP